MDINVLSVVALQILAVGAIAGALLLYLLKLKVPKLDAGRKAVFVTNCESQLGSECAKKLDELGLRVFAGFPKTDSERAKCLQAQTSSRLHLVEFDPSNCEKVEQAVEFVHQHLPADDDGLWALINTSSECIGGLLERLTWGQVERQVHVNLVAVIRITKAFLPLLKKTKGRLISVVSLGGQPCYPGFAVYASCKAGLEGFFEALRYEMQKYEVKFISIAPTIQYQFESQRQEQIARGPQGPAPVESKFGAKPKMCVLDLATREAAIADLEDAVLSVRPMSEYTSAPTRNRFRNVAYSCLPTTWKRQRLARDFQTNFMDETDERHSHFVQINKLNN